MRRDLVLAVAVALALPVAGGYPVAAQAGLLSSAVGMVEDALNELLSMANSNAVLGTGKALNTGQMQQLQAQQTLDNQKLQEAALARNQLADANAVVQYQGQTAGFNQLPGEVCQQQAMAAATGQAETGASAQGQAIAMAAVNGLVPGGAVYTGDATQQPPTSLQSVQSVAAATSAETDAASLYQAKGALSAPVTANLLINPLSVQPLTPAQAATPAGQRFVAFYNANAAVLSIAAQALGKVGGLHAISLPASAVAATAQAVSATASVMSAAVPTVPASTPAPPAPTTTSPPAQQASGAWTGLVPKYANQVASVAAQDNVPPAWLAATIAHEDGGEILTAMPCGSVSNASPYNSNGFSSYICRSADSSAKSLGQFTDPTWETYAPGVSPMLGTESATAELNTMGIAAKSLLSRCGGNVACAFAKWNQGAGTPYAPGVDAAYVNRSLSFYSGDLTVPAGQYVGPESSSSGSSSGGASDMGLLRLISEAAYANPAWYAQLASTGKTGALRTAAFLNAQDLVLNNQRRRLLEEYAMIQAARLSLSMQKNTAALNVVRGQAMSQYAAEGPWTKFWNWASNTL